MISSLRISTIRLVAGATLAVIGLGVFGFVLPDAAQSRKQREKAAAEALGNLRRQEAELKASEQEAARIQVNRQALEDLLKTMPAQGVDKLAWDLSKTLFDLTGKHSVRLLSVKYGQPSREGAKGMQMESVDVEFNVTGIYSNLKGFMLELEGSKLPFAVVTAKLDESPDGAHLMIVLRAFRQLTGPAAETQVGETP